MKTAHSNAELFSQDKEQKSPRPKGTQDFLRRRIAEKGQVWVGGFYVE